MAKSSNNSYAKVILDSVGPNGKRLVTVEARYWRAIHAEIMTHRDRARNTASSRAIPFYRTARNADGAETPVENCTWSRIANDPFFPEFIGLEKSGMQSGEEIQGADREAALEAIDRMRRCCMEECMSLRWLGVHKSIINRYLEPWSYVTVLMTATEWRNFFRLRIHPKAEKHFNKVAGQIKQAIDASTPQKLEHGDWHLPYLRPAECGLLRDPDAVRASEILGGEVCDWIGRDIVQICKRVSAARCARLSYLTHEGVRDVKKDLKLFDDLINPKIDEDRDDDVIHSSPLEHVAMATCKSDVRSGPFRGWIQFRKEFPNENVEG